MKIVLEDSDYKYINRINEDLKNNDEDIPLFVRKDMEPSIKFKVVDAAKANAFAWFLMSKNNIDNLREDAGIEVLSINYSDDIIKGKVKQILQDLLVEIDKL